MINLLFRFMTLKKARFSLMAKPLAIFPQESIRKEMGIVLQDPYLFTGTIASNVTMGMRPLMMRLSGKPWSGLGPRI